MSSNQDGRVTVPRWLAPVAVGFLGLQLGLLYLQGGLLHRQGAELRSMREEIQYLTELVETNAMDAPDGLAPSRGKAMRPRLQKASFILEEEPEPAVREVEASRKSAQKATRDAQQVQQNLNVEHHSRQAEQQAQQQASRRSWQPMVGIGLAVAALALVARALVRHRG